MTRITCSFRDGFVAIIVALALAPSAYAELLQLGDVFVTNYSVSNGGAVRFNQSIMRVDPGTGDRTIVSGVGVGGGVSFIDPRGVAVRRQGDVIVADVGRRSLVSVDPVTGRRSTISSAAIGDGPAFTAPFSIAPLPNGDMYVADVTLDAIFFVDGVTGDRTIVSSDDVGDGEEFGNLTTITLDASGRLIAGDQTFDALIDVDLATGDRTIISKAGSVGTGTGFASPIGMSVASSARSSCRIAARTAVLLSVDPTSGNRTVLSGGAVGAGVALSEDIRDMALELNGRIVVVDEDNDSLVRVNPTSGFRSTLSSPAVGSGPVLDIPNGVDVVTVLPGDFNVSGGVNDEDLTVWEAGFGTDFRGRDLVQWQRYFGSGSVGISSVPEPYSVTIAVTLALLLVFCPRPRRRL